MYPASGNPAFPLGLDRRILAFLCGGPYVRLSDLCTNGILKPLWDLLPDRAPTAMETFRYHQLRHFVVTITPQLRLTRPLTPVEDMCNRGRTYVLGNIHALSTTDVLRYTTTTQIPITLVRSTKRDVHGQGVG
ncbi:Hypothetical predicted protein [Pelobates cultripes]|uniref:Uncharacterized protein n=1 Tax=Pelobates cultripes TaxID=61616 RepID=A0AAD1SJ40_PELCU|nr:Hypothetical predicted protein [Pelobates cultripes]